jgi:hypothetical protein
VHSVFCEFIGNSNIVVSFGHKMAMKLSENDETERQLKFKIYDMGLCIFGCFKEYHIKARFSYMKQRGEVRIYNKQITTKKV